MNHTFLASCIVSLLSAVGVGTAHAGIAGIYDFDSNNLNDMRKAYRICAFTRYQKGDCPDIWVKCHRYPLMGFSGSKCHKPPRFTNKNDDAHKALNDGQQMLNGGQPSEDDPLPPTAEQEAEAARAAEEAGIETEDPCAGAADALACAQARVADAGGEDAYAAQYGAINDDKGAAIAAANAAGQPMVAAILGAAPPPEATTEGDLTGEYSDTDVPADDYDYESEYGLPPLGEELAVLPTAESTVP